MKTLPRLVVARLSCLLILGLLCFGVVACQAEGRPGGVQSVGGSRSGSVSGAGTQPGVVHTPPPGITQVTSVLREWSITAQPASVPAGIVYFLADNQGPDDPHELVIVRTDLAPDQLPIQDGRVPENQVQVIGEIEPFAPRSRASGVFNLTPGRYALICNIAEMEGGQLESHVQLGMRTAFTVN